MIRTLLWLNPVDGDRESVLAYFNDEKVLERSSSIEGFLAAELHVPLVPGPLMVTAAWENVASYERWISDPWRGQSSVQLAKLLDQEMQATTRGSLYQLAHGVGILPNSKC